MHDVVEQILYDGSKELAQKDSETYEMSSENQVWSHPFIVLLNFI